MIRRREHLRDRLAIHRHLVQELAQRRQQASQVIVFVLSYLQVTDPDDNYQLAGSGQDPGIATAFLISSSSYSYVHP